MAVKVHETGYGKWKVPVIIIAVNSCFESCGKRAYY